MIIGSVIGNIGFFKLIVDYTSQQIDSKEMQMFLTIFLMILSYVATGGGISVIIGSLIAAKEIRLGKFIIAVGAGMGLIGLIIFLATSIIAGSILSDMLSILNGIINGSYEFLAVLLIIFSRRKIKKS
ncbi:MAG: hypothetical protein ACTSVV_06265 [Promethearchaeota archaeon]